MKFSKYIFKKIFFTKKFLSMVSATTVRKRARVAANDIRIIFQLENHGASRAATVNAQRAVDTSTSGYNTPAHVSPTVLVCVCCVCERKRETGKNGDKSADGACESASSSNHVGREKSERLMRMLYCGLPDAFKYF